MSSLFMSIQSTVRLLTRSRTFKLAYSTTPTRIPPELILLIIEEVQSPADLYSLSLVSRDFNAWAEPALYRRVYITQLRDITTFKTLATSPHLASHVQHIHISLDIQSGPNPIRSVTPALKSLKNLTSLTLYAMPWFPFIPEIAIRLRSFVYLGCHFASAGEITKELKYFLEQCINLERLELRCPIFWDGVLSPQTLPKLTTLFAPAHVVPPLILARPVTHLTSVCRKNATSDRRTSGPSRLRSLWVQEASWIPCYGEYFPHLRLLQVMRTIKLIPYLQGVPVLEKIKVSSFSSVWRWTATDAEQAFAVCPSLQRIELRKNIERQEGTAWIRGVETPLRIRWDDDEWLYV